MHEQPTGQHVLYPIPSSDIISPRSPRDGEVVLVGEDGLGVMVHGYQLKTYSPIFRLMLETTHISSSPIPLPVHSSDLVILRALMDSSPSSHLPLVSLNIPLLTLCETFDMPLLATHLLRSTRLPADHHPRTCRSSAMDRLEMFTWASKLDCPDVGAKVLLDLAYADPATVCRRMPGGPGFDRDTARLLRSDWVWAVDRARGETVGAGVEWGDRGYWTAVGLSFAEMMLR